LNSDETIRLVVKPYGTSKVFTDKHVINKFDDLIELIQKKPKAEFAMSSAVFDATNPSRGKEAIKRTRSFIMD